MRNRTVVALVAGLLLAALAGWSQTIGSPVEGKVTQEGKPLANAQLVFTNADTGRNYKTKTDKDGGFGMVGVPYGNYQVDVLDEKGTKLFTQKTSIGTGDTSQSTIVTLDVPKGGMAQADNKFGIPEAPPPKLTKEQIAKIEADNKKIAGLNSLISEAQSARQAQDWPKAENALKQLLVAAPDTTRWDFYMFLGEAQSRSNKLPDAAQTYDKGIQLAQGMVSGSTPANTKVATMNPATAKVGIGRMLTAQGNVYLKMQEPDEAIASLKKAAQLDPASAMAAYNLCGVEFNAGKYPDARTDCNKYLSLEPSGAHADEVKTFIAQMGQK